MFAQQRGASANEIEVSYVVCGFHMKPQVVLVDVQSMEHDR